MGVAFIDHWNPHRWRQHLWRLQPQSPQAGDRAHPKAPRLPPRSANLISLRRWMWVQKRRLQRKKMNPTFGAFWLLATRRLAAWRYRFAQKCDLNPILRVYVTFVRASITSRNLKAPFDWSKQSRCSHWASSEAQWPAAQRFCRSRTERRPWADPRSRIVSINQMELLKV